MIVMKTEVLSHSQSPGYGHSTACTAAWEARSKDEQAEIGRG